MYVEGIDRDNPGRSGYIIDSAQPLRVFFELRSSLEATALAQYFCELSVELVPDGAEHFTVTVRAAKVSAGAGFVVVFTGNILTMPGLPALPAAENIDVDENGVITGLF